MDWYLAAPVWTEDNDCPHTSDSAVPCDPKLVKNKTVIHVQDACYRGSTFSGTFVLAEDVTLPLPKNGTERIEVYCRWFAHRLKRDGLHFEIDLSKAEIEQNYSRFVSSDFLKRT